MIPEEKVNEKGDSKGIKTRRADARGFTWRLN